MNIKKFSKTYFVRSIDAVIFLRLLGEGEAGERRELDEVFASLVGVRKESEGEVIVDSTLDVGVRKELEGEVDVDCTLDVGVRKELEGEELVDWTLDVGVRKELEGEVEVVGVKGEGGRGFFPELERGKSDVGVE